MATEFATNYALNAANHTFSVIWKLTRVMKKAGWVFKASGDGTTASVAGKTSLAANDHWGTNADPLADTYPSGFDSLSPWIVLEGPRTIKCPITSTLNSNFIRGEKVTQSATSSEGELLGYVFDSIGVTGHAVILDRLGTTWDTTAIVGATSGQTFSPSATPKVFRRQVMFWKSSANTTDGYVAYICSDESLGIASDPSIDGLFSADSIYSPKLYDGAFGTIAPGGRNTANNRLPTKAMAIKGTFDQGTGTPTPAATRLLDAVSSIGTAAQICAVNNIGATNVSPDGTFWAATNYTAVVNTFLLFGFFRVDDSEPGDVDPFIFFSKSGTASASFNRYTGTNPTSPQLAWNVDFSGDNVTFRGYCARGLGGTKDDATYFRAAWMTSPTSSIMTHGWATGAFRVANHPAGTTPLFRENVKLFSERTNMKIFKGSIRWMFMIPSGAAYDTADTKSYLVVVVNNGATNAGILIGPYDGSTTPTYP